MRAASSSAAKSGGGRDGGAASASSSKSDSTPPPAPCPVGTCSGTGFWSPTCSPRRTRVPTIRSSGVEASPGRTSTIPTASPRSRLDKDVFTAALYDDLFGVFQSAHDVDNALLGLLDLP